MKMDHKVLQRVELALVVVVLVVLGIGFVVSRM